MYTLTIKPTKSPICQYKLDITFRNHDKIKKTELIPLLAACIPAEGGHKVNLERPEVVIIVNVLKVIQNLV